MRLIHLKAKNFRSLADVKLKFDKLTVLIGENDAGKSSTLDLLELALGNQRPDDNDFYQHEIEDLENQEQRTREQAQSIQVELEFLLEASDVEAHQYAINNKLVVQRTWKKDGVEPVAFKGLKASDPRLAADFTKLKKAELESLIQELEPAALLTLKTNDDKSTWLEERAKNSPKVEGWIPAPIKWAEILPRFERYRAMDYSSPDSVVMKTLRQVYAQVIYEEADVDGQKVKRLNQQLTAVKNAAETRIKDKIQELLSFVKLYAPRIKDVSFEALIDFTGGLRSGEFQIDDGRGLHYLSKVGDGTKRRIFMAALDWDRDITIQQAIKGGASPQIIRGYDEPDSNLHYEAQRLMYRAIAEIAETQNSRTQVIVCTHSLTMVDRAPAKSINLLRLRSGCTCIERLETNDDPSVEQFLADLAQELGITNTMMFYERCFILIEGETEANALPAFYRLLHGRSLLEDGIRLINVKGNGATKEFLRLMGRNKQKITIAFMDRDSDAKHGGNSAKLTKTEFKEAGFTDEFIEQRLIYAGAVEFEDAFSDEILALALQEGYPKIGGLWGPDDIATIRNSTKLSDALGHLVFRVPVSGNNKWGKPEFGKCLGRVCQHEIHLPNEIRDLFRIARSVAGCE